MMDCVSSLVESESVPVSSGFELVEFGLVDICDSLISSLDWLDSVDTVDAGSVGLVSGEVSALGVFLFPL